MRETAVSHHARGDPTGSQKCQAGARRRVARDGCHRLRRRDRFRGDRLLRCAQGPPGGRRSSVPAQPAPVASAAHVVNVKDEGHLHLVRSSGSELVEEGPVSGSIPGKAKVSFNIGATITAKFTIYANGGGSIDGSGGGALHSTSVYSTFGGSLKVTGGSGRYAARSWQRHPVRLRSTARRTRSPCRLTASCTTEALSISRVPSRGEGNSQGGAPGRDPSGWRRLRRVRSRRRSGAASASSCSPARKPTNATTAATAMIAGHDVEDGARRVGEVEADEVRDRCDAPAAALGLGDAGRLGVRACAAGRPGRRARW